MRNRNISFWLVTVLLALGLAVSTGLAQDNAAPADEAPALRELPTEAPAETEQPADTVPQDPNQPGGGGLLGPKGLFGNKIIFIMLGAVVLMWFMSSRSKKKQEKKRKDMLASLSKGDKVTSIGGIVGTVIEVREDEVTVKVDDSCRMKFARWAIRGVGEEGKTEEKHK